MTRPVAELRALRVEQAERRAQALRYRKAGMTYEQVGAQLGITRQAAAQLLSRAIHEIKSEGVAELRTLENERLDDMLRAIYEVACAGGDRAIGRVLQIMERRAKLWGLDAPVKQELSGPEGGPLGVQVFDHGNVTAAIAARSSDYHLPPSED